MIVFGIGMNRTKNISAAKLGTPEPRERSEVGSNHREPAPCTSRPSELSKSQTRVHSSLIRCLNQGSGIRVYSCPDVKGTRWREGDVSVRIGRVIRNRYPNLCNPDRTRLDGFHQTQQRTRRVHTPHTDTTQRQTPKPLLFTSFLFHSSGRGR